MLAKRLPLLSAFSGGCLFSAALIGFWCVDAAKHSSAVNPGVGDRTTAAWVPPSATSSVLQRAHPDDATGDAIDHGRDAMSGEPSSPPRAKDGGGESVTEPGSSVADVLSHLEADYRQALVVADLRPPPSSSSAGRDLTFTSPGAEPRVAVRERTAPQPNTAGTEPPPYSGPANKEAAVALADAPAAPKNAHPADTQGAPVAAAPPVLAPRDDTRPPDAYVPDMPPNISVNNIGNLYQGDVYQVQQLAILQYIQLVAPLANARLAASAFTPDVKARRGSAFPTSLTNPDNPWGFNFHPPVLVK